MLRNKRELSKEELGKILAYQMKDTDRLIIGVFNNIISMVSVTDSSVVLNTSLERIKEVPINNNELVSKVRRYLSSLEVHNVVTSLESAKRMLRTENAEFDSDLSEALTFQASEAASVINHHMLLSKLLAKYELAITTKQTRNYDKHALIAALRDVYERDRDHNEASESLAVHLNVSIDAYGDAFINALSNAFDRVRGDLSVQPISDSEYYDIVLPHVFALKTITSV